MNRFAGIVMFCAVMSTLATGCAYRYYLGMHGPSIKSSLDIHQGVEKDRDCLDCHHPDQASEAPPTTHPRFTGCLKCHSS